MKNSKNESLKKRKKNVLFFSFKQLKFFVLFAIFLVPQSFLAYSFAWFSDVQLEVGNRNINDNEIRFSLSVSILENTVRKINESNVDFVVISGDIINNGRSWNLDAAKFILDKLEKKYYVILGNNDFAFPETGMGISKSTFEYAFRKHQPHLQEMFWFDFPVTNVLLVGLNNINPISSGVVWTNKLLSELERLFRENSEKEIIVFVHYPVVELDYSGNGKPLYSANDFLSLCRKYKVKMIGSGHYHYKEFQKIHGVVNAVCPSLTQFPHQFLIVKSEKNQLEIFSQNVLDVVTTEESKRFLRSKIKRILYANPDLTEETILQKISGKEKYQYGKQ